LVSGSPNGWTGLAAITAGCGAPIVLLANGGLLFAPAAHGGALFPGVTPLMVAILAAAILREPFTFQKRMGCTLIVSGAIGIVWGAGGTIGTTQNLGHLLFLSAGLAWACYTVAMRRARLDEGSKPWPISHGTGRSNALSVSRLPMDKITGMDARFRYLRAVSMRGVMQRGLRCYRHYTD
jgi:drug/metabolite transporter (DMT)-like permease